MKKADSCLLVLILLSGINLVYLYDARRNVNDRKSNPETKSQKNLTEDYRLPLTIFPERYKVTLEPVLNGNFSFAGFTEIEATVANKTNEITLHCRHLRLEDCQVYTGNVRIDITNTTYNNLTEKFTMHLQSYLLPGSSVRILIGFQGLLGTENTGFYKSFYYDSEGQRRWLAVTKFQPNHARAAFPCFDEPLFKARFIFFIRRPKNFSAITNMPKFTSQESWNSVLDVFEESPRMSTYLVAILVSDFSSLIHIKSKFRLWAKPDSIEHGYYALNYVAKVLPYFKNLFEQKNAVPKTDIAAVPDLDSGGMENWGLVTYSEELILHDPHETSIDAEQSVPKAIAHECAHMWFGNLITPKWWEHLWLSEGFASYFEYMATSEIQPNWKMDQRILVDVVQPAFFTDSAESSPAVCHTASNNTQVQYMFHEITYRKGGSIVRMMEMSFGSSIFLDTLTKYIDKYKFGNVETNDFWEVLQSQVDKHGYELNSTVKTVMDDWITKPGYPLLTVDIKDDEIHLSQNRFFLNKTNKDNSTWFIPISYASLQNPDFSSAVTNTWMRDNMTINVENASNTCVIFNIRGAGFYRVNYDKSSWYRIIDALKSVNFGAIHEMNRAAIVDDLLNLARAELLDYEVTLDALQYLTEETNYLPWKSALRGLEFLTQRFNGQKHYVLYRSQVICLFKNAYRKIGFEDLENDDTFTILLRAELNALACSFEYKPCISAAQRHFSNWRKNETNRVMKNHRFTVYCHAIREGTDDDWHFLSSQRFLTIDRNERLVITRALGCTRNATLLERHLLSALTNFTFEHKIRKQDSLPIILAVPSDNSFGSKYMLKFVEKHLSRFTNHFGGNREVVRVIQESIKSFTTERSLKMLENYLQRNEKAFIAMKKELESTLDSAKKELEWYMRNHENIIEWMNEAHPGFRRVP